MAVFYTIGHSNLAASEFIDLLSAHGIEVVIDVRSAPYSKYASQFNKSEIEQELRSHQFHYIYLGDKLGGKAKSPGFLTPAGAPNYEAMAATDSFRLGIEEIEELAEQQVIVLMCSEADPKACHRDRLLGWKLRERGHEVRHIVSDGTIAREEQGSLL